VTERRKGLRKGREKKDGRDGETSGYHAATVLEGAFRGDEGILWFSEVKP
jgi:hypothetical protein